ncbi:MAG TPA: DUF2232 domain-containing protein [Longimicrobiaceae bacterium]|nr:DUF2232 domain-containing protein [Longimicrobiaceae bacterium]
MTASEEERTPGWGTAVALGVAVLLLAVLDALPLVALPLAVLLLAFPGGRRLKWIVAGLAIWILITILPGGPLGVLSRGWGLILGSVFVATTLIRPTWGVLPRALTSVALALVGTSMGLALSGDVEAVDLMMQSHFLEASEMAFADLKARMPDSEWVAEFGSATRRVATVQWRVFPAVLALQSLAALAMASWWIARFRGDAATRFRLRPLRDFRFSDQLIWVFITGLALVLIPLGADATRTGYNALLFMGGLYALRGIAVFIFLIGGAPTFLMMIIGAIAAIFLYPFILTAALLVGVGDTWLDVRGRARPATRP